MEKHLKLLISNDTDEFARSYSHDFEVAGIDVVYSPKDGLRVLDHIDLEQPDVVLVDLFMPMDRRISSSVMPTFKRSSRGSSNMLHSRGFLAEVFGILARHNISVDLITTSQDARLHRATRQRLTVHLLGHRARKRVSGRRQGMRLRR